VADAQALTERLDGPDTTDTWFGYPAQKHHVHLSQVYTIIGDTTAARTAQDEARKLTASSSVLTRDLLGLDASTCAHHDGGPGVSAAMAPARFSNYRPATAPDWSAPAPKPGTTH